MGEIVIKLYEPNGDIMKMFFLIMNVKKFRNFNNVKFTTEAVSKDAKPIKPIFTTCFSFLKIMS